MYIGMVAILFNGAEPFVQIVNTLLIEGPIWYLVKTGRAVSEKKTFKDNIHLFYIEFIHSPILNMGFIN